MSATFYGLERGTARGADDYAAARRRLTLAVLWLAGLIAWGLLSYAVEADAQAGARAVPTAQAFDGHGKWTGY